MPNLPRPAASILHSIHTIALAALCASCAGSPPPVQSPRMDTPPTQSWRMAPPSQRSNVETPPVEGSDADARPVQDSDTAAPPVKVSGVENTLYLHDDIDAEVPSDSPSPVGPTGPVRIPSAAESAAPTGPVRMPSAAESAAPTGPVRIPSAAGSATPISPSSSPAATEVFRLDPGMERPRRISGRKIVYTEEARKAKVEGLMIITCMIEKDGSVTNCRVIKPLDPLTESVLSALATQRYTPAYKNGEAVRVPYVFNIRFKSH